MRALRLLMICGALLTALGAPLSAQAPDFAETKKRAEAGDASAQYNLGVMYRNGNGVPKDDAEAVKWYRKAADQGHADSQLSLGDNYAAGHGVPKDDAEAVKWYRKAADQGNAAAQYNLGFIYEKGFFLTTGQDVEEILRLIEKGGSFPKDYAEAVKWYRKAADQGSAIAQNNLGEMYYNGAGVSQDYAEALRLFLKAADRGIPSALSSLGNMYYKGEGVPKDDIEAYAWYNLAAAKDPLFARKNRDFIASRLPPEVQILAQQRTKQLQQEIENREIERLKKEDRKRREEMKKGA